MNGSHYWAFIYMNISNGSHRSKQERRASLYKDYCPFFRAGSIHNDINIMVMGLRIGSLWGWEGGTFERRREGHLKLHKI